MKNKKAKAVPSNRILSKIDALRAHSIALQEYLARELRRVVRDASDTPVVNFNIRRFPPRTRTVVVPKVDFTMSVKKTGGRVYLRPSDPNTLGVSLGGPLLIQFTITGGPFVPIRASFENLPGGFGPGVDADENFPQELQTPDQAYLTFGDLYRGYLDQYTFVIFVKNTVTGGYGVIDPGIQHINSNA